MFSILFFAFGSPGGDFGVPEGGLSGDRSSGNY